MKTQVQPFNKIHRVSKVVWELGGHLQSRAIFYFEPFILQSFPNPLTNWSLALAPTHPSSPICGIQIYHETSSQQPWPSLTVDTTRSLNYDPWSIFYACSLTHTRQMQEWECYCQVLILAQPPTPSVITLSSLGHSTPLHTVLGWTTCSKVSPSSDLPGFLDSEIHQTLSTG